MGPIINDVTQIGGGVSYFLTVQKIKGMGVRGGSKIINCCDVIYERSTKSRLDYYLR